MNDKLHTHDHTFLHLGTQRRKACPACCEGATFTTTWEKGTTSKGPAFRCPNCNNVQHYTARKARKGLSNSQQAQIARIKRFYGERKHETLTFEAKETDYGVVWLYVRPVGNIWDSNAAFTISKRGKLTLWHASTNLNSEAEHISAMLNAKIKL